MMKLFLVVIVSALASATANTTSNMTAVAWGKPGYGGDSSSVDLSTGVESAMCGGYACVAVMNGSAVAWGHTDRGGDSSSVDLSTGVESAICGGMACVAVMVDGSAVTWGNAFSGGDSSSVDLSTGVEFAMCGGFACVAVKTPAAAYELHVGGKGMNCAMGFHLEDVVACEAYANDNGIEWKASTASNDRPKGCYAQHTKAGARVGVYFNEATAPKRNVWGRTRPICKGKWSFTPEFKFVEAYEGRNCAPGKFVATSSDCAAAADEMGLALGGEIYSMKRPGGCFHSHSGMLHFNTRLVAYQGGRYGRRGTG